MGIFLITLSLIVFLIAFVSLFKPSIIKRDNKIEAFFLCILVSFFFFIVGAWVGVDYSNESPSVALETVSNHKLPTASDIANIKIIKDYRKHNIKRSVDVVIDRHITAKEVKIISDEIKGASSMDFENTYIAFFVGDINNGQWGISRYEPEYSFLQQGLKPDDLKFFSSLKLKSEDGKKASGTKIFIQDSYQVPHAISIVWDDTYHEIMMTFSDGENTFEEVKKKTVNGEIRYYFDSGGPDSDSYYYVINGGVIKAYSSGDEYDSGYKPQGYYDKYIGLSKNSKPIRDQVLQVVEQR